MLPEVVFHLPTGNYLQLYILEKKKIILIISYTSYWYYTCCCRLNNSLAEFQIVENKALLPHLPLLIRLLFRFFLSHLELSAEGIVWPCKLRLKLV